MTQKQKALSQLARLALNAESEAPAKQRKQTSLLVAEALNDELPELAQLARSHAALLAEQDSHYQELFKRLHS